jgi:hypothetical protein
VSVTTFVGSCGTTSGGFADGVGTAAKFLQPRQSTVDLSGNLIVADASNARIRSVTSSGAVSTIAGNGNAVSVDGVGTAASFNGLFGVCVNSVNTIFVTEVTSSLIRKIVNGMLLLISLMLIVSALTLCGRSGVDLGWLCGRVCGWCGHAGCIQLSKGTDHNRHGCGGR